MMNGIITLLYLFLQYSDAFAIKILTFMKQTYYNSFSNVEKNHVGGSPKSNLLFTILNQNNINVNVLFALLGLILGKISYKMLIITFFGYKNFKQKFITKFDIFHKKNSTEPSILVNFWN